MRGRRPLTLFVSACALALAGLANAAVEIPVIKTALVELNPAAAVEADGDLWLGWAQNSRAKPNRFHAYLRPPGETKIKINAPDTRGFTGGIDLGEMKMVFQQIANNQSNLRFFDLTTRMRVPMATGVNTPKWEWHPTYSHPWLLFSRDNTATPTQRVVLHNADTHEERVIAVVTRWSHFLAADQVSGNWAVYTKCAPVCNVFRYDIAARTTMRVPKPATTRPRYQFGGSVLPDGTVYLARSGRACGSSVRILRYFSAAPDPLYGTPMVSLPQGKDFRFSQAVTNAGQTQVFYDRAACSADNQDIYKINDP